MARSNLQGIANGLLGAFVSRNNDIDGYWGLGMLRSEAAQARQQEITINLLIEQTGTSAVRTCSVRYRKWLEAILSKQHLELRDLSVAAITIRFADSFDDFPGLVKDTRGLPYMCSVELRRPSRKMYVSTKIGVCALHDPSKDRRSTRVL